MLNPLRVAVIGVGSMGRNHARVWASMPGVELVGVADEDVSRAEAVAAEFGTRPYWDADALILDERPDAVSVAVPTGSHKYVAGVCIYHGCHVLVEKPIANHSVKGEILIEEARQKGRVLAVGHIERYNPAVRELKRQIEAGDLGEIYAIHCRRVGPFTPRQRDVGVTLDLAVHDLDLLRWLTGREGRVVGAAVRGGIRTEHDDSVSAVLWFSGIGANMQADWLSVTKERTIRVVAERGVWTVDLVDHSLWVECHGRPCQPWAFYPKEEPLALELAEFAKACRGEPAQIVSGEDGRAAVRLAEQVLEVARVEVSSQL